MTAIVSSTVALSTTKPPGTNADGPLPRREAGRRIERMATSGRQAPITIFSKCSLREAVPLTLKLYFSSQVEVE